jgi:hypothetical protein
MTNENLVNRLEGTANSICPFADAVSHFAKNLYFCTLKKKCDDQKLFGYKNYCGKYLNNAEEQIKTYEEIQEDKYGRDEIKKMQDNRA